MHSDVGTSENQCFGSLKLSRMHYLDSLHKQPFWEMLLIVNSVLLTYWGIPFYCS